MGGQQRDQKKSSEINMWCIIIVQLPGLLGDHIRMRGGGRGR